MIGGWQITDDGLVRGTRYVGARAAGTVRLLVVDGASASRAVAEVRVDEGGFGSSASLAVRSAVRAGAAVTLRALANALLAAWPRNDKGAAVAVQVRAGKYSLLAELIGVLERTPGVGRVAIARLEVGEVWLTVTGSLGGAALARSLAAAQFTCDSPAVRPAVDHVKVEWPVELDGGVEREP